MAIGGRSFSGGQFALTLDGVQCGMVNKFEGLNISAPVIENPVSCFYTTMKTIGPLKYNGATIQLASIDSGPVADWIEQTLRHNFLRKSGAMIAYNFKNEAMANREFRDALVTNVSMPALDAAGKDPCFFSLKFEPELIRNSPGDKSKGVTSSNVKQKLISGQNWKLSIDGLEDACKRVNKVSSIDISIQTAVDEVGLGRDMFREPCGQMKYKDLDITLTGADAEPFIAWHQKFCVEGHASQSDEKQGSLIMYDQSGTKELCEVTLKNLGVFDCQYDAPTNNDAKIYCIKLSMYMEECLIKFKG